MNLSERKFKGVVGQEVFYCGNPVKILADLKNNEYVIDILSHVLHEDSGDPFEQPYQEPMYTSLIVDGKYLSETKDGIENWLKEKISEHIKTLKDLDNKIIEKKRASWSLDKELQSIADKYKPHLEHVEMFYKVMADDFKYIIIQKNDYYRDSLYLLSIEEFNEEYSECKYQFTYTKSKPGRPVDRSVFLTKDGHVKCNVLKVFDDRDVAINALTHMFDNMGIRNGSNPNAYEELSSKYGVKIPKWDEYAKERREEEYQNKVSNYKTLAKSIERDKARLEKLKAELDNKAEE